MHGPKLVTVVFIVALKMLSSGQALAQNYIVHVPPPADSCAVIYHQFGVDRVMNGTRGCIDALGGRGDVQWGYCSQGILTRSPISRLRSDPKSCEHVTQYCFNYPIDPGGEKNPPVDSQGNFQCGQPVVTAGNSAPGARTATACVGGAAGVPAGFCGCHVPWSKFLAKFPPADHAAPAGLPALSTLGPPSGDLVCPTNHGPGEPCECHGPKPNDGSINGTTEVR